MSALVALGVAVPLLAAAVLASLRTVVRHGVLDAVAILAALATLGIDAAMMHHAITAPATIVWFGGWRPSGGFPPGIAFVADLPATAIATLGAILATASLVFSSRYFETTATLFNTLVLVFLAAVNGYCLSGDLFTLFVFFELMGTTAYALTGHKIETNSLEGAIGFAVLNSLGAFLLLWGIGMLYGRLGGLNLAWLGVALAGAHPGPAYLGVAYAFVASGFLVKAAIVPFHFWHADADAVAPTPVCVLISGIMAELGLVGLARVTMTVFAPAFGPVRLAAIGHDVIAPLGIATAIVGGLMCVRQRHIKRLLAFSTIAHVGLMICGVAAFDREGLGGAGLYLVGHGFVKSALFLATGVMLVRRGSVDEVDLHGKGRDMPLAAAVFFLGAVGLAGVPPFGTFTGKSLLEHAGLPWLPTLFVAVEAATAGAVLRVAFRVFLGLGDKPRDDGDDSPSDRESQEAESGHGSRSRGLAMIAIAGVLLVLAVVMTVVPGVRGEALGAAGLFLNHAAYAQALLRDGSYGPAGAVAPPELWSSVWVALGTLGLAVVLALVPIYSDRVLSPLRAAWKAGPDRVLVGLEWVHSGHLGDYAGWLAAGFGGLAAGLTLVLG